MLLPAGGGGAVWLTEVNHVSWQGEVLQLGDWCSALWGNIVFTGWSFFVGNIGSNDVVELI